MRENVFARGYFDFSAFLFAPLLIIFYKETVYADFNL